MMMRPAISALLFLVTVVAPPVFNPPPTAKRPVTDTYHGDAVADDYRWLENWEDAEVRAWSGAQNAAARRSLDALPARPAIEKRVARLLSWESPSYGGLVHRGGLYFAIKQQPPQQQPLLVVLPSVEGAAKERVLVDPNAIDPSGGTSIDWFAPSLDGKRVLVSLSRGGSEAGDGHLFDVTTGKEVEAELISRVNSGTAGGGAAWNSDESGFWYTRQPAPGEAKDEDLEFYQKIYFHKVGAAAQDDRCVLGSELPRVAESVLQSSEDGRLVFDLVQKGDGGEYELYLHGPGADGWRKIAGYEDQVIEARFGDDNSLWLLSRKDAGRGQILHLSAGAPNLAAAHCVVPEGSAAIEDFLVTRNRLWVLDQLGGPCRLHRYDLQGADLGEVPILPASSVGYLARAGDDQILFTNETDLKPSAWFMADGQGRVGKTSLAQTSPVDLSAYEVLQLETVSKDGTRIPFRVVQPIGSKRDGSHPLLLTGYGGFGISMPPGFQSDRAVWLEQGGLWAVANLRGGGEFGQAWHHGGWRANKQNVFDDFIAVATQLMADGFTTPERLVIQGGSNGGLLMGAVLTQRPDLFRAVVSEVGYYDMLRYETRPNGAFNNTEYGSVADEAEYRALRAYSPYHKVQEGTKYPPVLFMTGTNDPRVDPMHSRKMVARLQAVGGEALLRTSGSTGHGIGTPLAARIAETTDIYAFLFSQAGMSYGAVGR